MTVDPVAPVATRQAFTLIELVLVLVILTTLATVALRMVEPQVDQARFEATQTLLLNTTNAIYQRSTGADGRVAISGFYADMGRLPRAVADPNNADLLTLRELWDPTLLPAYRTVEASAANVSTVKDSDDGTVVFDSSLTLDFGWRGPYLQLPVGAVGMRDGWGTDLISTVSGSTYSHLRGVGDAGVAAADDEIVGVRSLGADNVLDDGSEATYESDLPRINDGLPLNLRALEGTVSGILYVHESHSAVESNLVVQLYFPDPNVPGMIAIERASVKPHGSPGTPYNLFRYWFEDKDGREVKFAVGPRVIRAYDPASPDASGDFGDDGENAAPSSVPIRFVLDTANTIDLTIP